MNPINLLLPDGHPSKVWACGECKMVRSDEDAARRCCTPVPCQYCAEPAEKLYRHGYETADHDRCRSAEYARRSMERMEKAKKLDYWDGWVWDESRYYRDLDDYIEHLECNIEDPTDWPDYVYVANARPGVSLDMATILERACDDGYDDMGDDLKGCDELSAAIHAFNAANKDVIVYDGDYSRAVRVPKPEGVTHDHA